MLVPKWTEIIVPYRTLHRDERDSAGGLQRVLRGIARSAAPRWSEREYSPHRLLYLQKHTGAHEEKHFARITWWEALDKIAAHLPAVADDWRSIAWLA